MKTSRILLSLLLVLALPALVLFGQTPSYESYGDKISAEDAMAYEQLIEDLEGKDSLQAKVVGTVNEVCKVKGCWMTLSSAHSSEPIMVRFKDYGFFVPKDISGKEVIVEGIAYRDLTPVDELRHYAEDAGKSKEEIEAITEPREEVRFLANGVLVSKE